MNPFVKLLNSIPVKGVEIKFIRNQTYKAGFFLFLGIIGFIEVFFYPNLDSVLTLQGYETFTLLSWFFAVNYLMNAVRIKKTNNLSNSIETDNEKVER